MKTTTQTASTASAEKRYPMRYVPKMLTPEDNQKQRDMLLKSKNEYEKGVYYTREKLASFKNKKSGHVANARKIYNIETLTPSKELALKTGCSLEALLRIVKKGEGAYFSSGSRPNQTAQSWGLARLASALTAGKAAAVDYKIIEAGCNHKKKAFILANKAKKKYKDGHSSAKKTPKPTKQPKQPKPPKSAK